MCSFKHHPSDSILLISFAGFDAVTLANNHLNDFGSEGANNSVEVLKKTGIQYFGISFGKYDSPQVSSFAVALKEYPFSLPTHFLTLINIRTISTLLIRIFGMMKLYK